MASSVERPVAVIRVNPAAFWVTVFLALLLQKFLPLKISFARLFDLPLLVTIYFALVRQNKIFGIGLGTALGLLQDAFTHGFIGIFGMTKAVVGYLAASAGVKFDLERLVARLVVAGVLVLVHNLCLQVVERGLLESVPPFQPLDLVVGVMVNVGLGLILFQVLDRFKQPA
jgi:rod shape-determining protein MreD